MISDVDPVWYHGSPYRLQVGDILAGGVKPSNFEESDSSVVSITTEVSYARSWARDAGKKRGMTRFFVYRVEPLGEVRHWRQGPKNFGRDIAYYESRVIQARVVAVVS